MADQRQLNASRPRTGSGRRRRPARVQLGALRQFTVFGGDAAGDLVELLAAGQFVLDHDEQLLQFDRDRHDRRQDDDERAVLLAVAICGARAWTISADCRKRWKLTQDQQRRAVGRGQRIERTDGGQGIVGAGVGTGYVVLTGMSGRGSMSQTASRQFSSRHIWAISARASSCSWDWTQRPVKQAEMYSRRRRVS